MQIACRETRAVNGKYEGAVLVLNIGMLGFRLED